MKKTLKLKLIKSNDKSQAGLIGINPFTERMDIIKGVSEENDCVVFMNSKTPYSIQSVKVIKPIAISDEEIKVNDLVWYTGWGVCKVRKFSEDYTTIFLETAIDNSIGGHVALTEIAVYIPRECPKKIELLPEQFSDEIKQAIVEGKLVDGDTLIAYNLDENNVVSTYMFSKEYDAKGNRISQSNFKEELEEKNIVYTEDMFKLLKQFEGNNYISLDSKRLLIDFCKFVNSKKK